MNNKTAFGNLAAPRRMLALGGVLALSAAASAQQITIDWFTIDAGGIIANSGHHVELSGTVGQADAGRLSGGLYSLSGGFWSAATCGSCRLYGDIVDTNDQPIPDCEVDLSDILCVVDDFMDPSGCAANGDIIGTDGTCDADGIYDIADILAALSAFMGTSHCPHPCARK